MKEGGVSSNKEKLLMSKPSLLIIKATKDHSPEKQVRVWTSRSASCKAATALPHTKLSQHQGDSAALGAGTFKLQASRTSLP